MLLISCFFIVTHYIKNYWQIINVIEDTGKGFRLKFNFSLCWDRSELQWDCDCVLRNGSLKLQVIILKSVELKENEISIERDSQYNKIKTKISATEFRNI